jgi:hypothetical protein
MTVFRSGSCLFIDLGRGCLLSGSRLSLDLGYYSLWVWVMTVWIMSVYRSGSWLSPVWVTAVSEWVMIVSRSGPCVSLDLDHVIL